nr:uracil-DNA glycosylase family protein [Natrinema marinum]
MRPPWDRSAPGDRAAVFGYGDANADFHVIGDYPGVHGGDSVGVPFTESESGVAMGDLLREIGFASGPRAAPLLENCFLSYVHMCRLPDGVAPTAAEYADLERFFDAELRAINAHVLLPVGERATDHVLREYTTQRHRFELDVAVPHAEEIRGRGFLVVPARDPDEWDDGDRAAIVDRLEALLASDYRQTKGVATTVG